MKNKNTKRSSERQFIRTMVITGIVGLIVMMITMISIIKAFGAKKITPNKVPPITSLSVEDEPVIDNKTVQGVIYEKGSQGKSIKIMDIENSKFIKIQIKGSSQLKDAYDKPLSIGELQEGDIIDIVYEEKSKNAITIQKSPNAWIKYNVVGAKIDIGDQKIRLENTIYKYTVDTLIIDEKLKIINMSDVREFDELVIKGIGDIVWSVQVLQSPGYIKLLNIPIQEGVVEIDNNRIYQLEEIKDDIPLSQGEHKIVVQMKGYHPFVEKVTITEAVVYEIDLQNVEKAISNLIVNVINTPVDYKIEINQQTYKKDEAIQVTPGSYRLKITADGFNPFERQIELKEGDQRIDVTLEEKEKELEKDSDQVTELPKPKPENKVEEEKEEEIRTVQIIIETEPEEAQVFVSGVYKGTTPALTGLKPGEYNISIEKEGYATLYTTIIIDGSNKQKSFLYMLEKQ